MPDVQKVPILLEMMFGEAAHGSMQIYSERMLKWSRAFDEWLEEYKRERSKSVYQNSIRTWQRLLDLVERPPWLIDQPCMEHFRAWMEERGMADSTILDYMRPISRFYRWCSQREIDSECGSDFDPTTDVSRPRIKKFSKYKILSHVEAQTFLDLLKNDTWLLSKRDYAFFLSRLRLGVPTIMLRQLQWWQIEVGQNGAQVRWRQGEPSAPLPEEVWQAILTYLEAAGRLGPARPGGMPPEAYIFAPLVEPLKTEPIGAVEEWDESRSLTNKNMNYILRRYGSLAGIPKDKLTQTTLHNTAAAHYLEAGGSLEDMDAFLGRPNAGGTDQYQKAIQQIVGGNKNEELKNKDVTSQLNEVDPPKQPMLPRRKPQPNQPGDNIRHGYYAQRLPAEELEAIRKENIVGINEEIEGLVLILEHINKVLKQAAGGQPPMALLDVFGQLSIRLVDMTEFQEQSKVLGKGDAWAVKYILHQAENQGRPIPTIEEMFEWVEQDDPATEETAHPLTGAIDSNRLVLRNLQQQMMEEWDPTRLAGMAVRFDRSCFRLMDLLKKKGSKENRLEMWLLAILNEAHRRKMEEWGVDSPGPWLEPL